jgi:uncharacterized protein
MQLTGEQRIAAPRAKVWEALNDPEVLRQCIPGCQSLEKETDDRFNAIAEVKIGPIGARFKGAVELSEIDAPNGYTISGKGHGGIAGNASGTARVRLSDDGAGTLLSYTVAAEVGGRMAQLGGPVIDATAKQLAGKFFAKFGEVVTGGLPATAAPVAAMVKAEASGSPFPWAWLIALAVAIIAGFLLGKSEATAPWVGAMIVLTVAAAMAGHVSGKRG